MVQAMQILLGNTACVPRIRTRTQVPIRRVVQCCPGKLRVKGADVPAILRALARGGSAFNWIGRVHRKHSSRLCGRGAAYRRLRGLVCRVWLVQVWIIMTAGRHQENGKMVGAAVLAGGALLLEGVRRGGGWSSCSIITIAAAIRTVLAAVPAAVNGQRRLLATLSRNIPDFTR